MNKLKVGIIGLGVGLKHLNCFEKNEFTEVVAVCDKNKKKFKLIKKNIVRYRDAFELIKDPNVDLVSICSNDDDHFKQIIFSIKHKKNIFCEKPICLNLKEYQEIKKKLSRNKIFFSTNFNLRTTPLFNELKNKLDKNKLGNVFTIEAGYESGRLFKITKGWRGKIKNYSLISGGMIHMIDLIFWLSNFLKKKNKINFYTIGNNLCVKKNQTSVDDNINCLLKINNINVYIKASLGCVTPHFHSLKVYGSKGTFIHDFKYKGYFFKKKEKLIFTETKSDYPGNYKHLIIDEFIKKVFYKKNKKNKRDIKDILKITYLALKFQKALEKNKKISLNV